MSLDENNVHRTLLLIHSILSIYIGGKEMTWNDSYPIDHSDRNSAQVIEDSEICLL